MIPKKTCCPITAMVKRRRPEILLVAIVEERIIQMVNPPYHLDDRLKVALEDGEILRDLLNNLKIPLPQASQDFPEEQILSSWYRWQTKMIEHLAPLHRETFLALRTKLPSPMTLESFRDHLAQCIERQLR